MNKIVQVVTPRVETVRRAEKRAQIVATPPDEYHCKAVGVGTSRGEYFGQAVATPGGENYREVTTTPGGRNWRRAVAAPYGEYCQEVVTPRGESRQISVATSGGHYGSKVTEVATPAEDAIPRVPNLYCPETLDAELLDDPCGADDSFLVRYSNLLIEIFIFVRKVVLVEWYFCQG